MYSYSVFFVFRIQILSWIQKSPRIFSYSGANNLVRGTTRIRKNCLHFHVSYGYGEFYLQFWTLLPAQKCSLFSSIKRCFQSPAPHPYWLSRQSLYHSLHILIFIMLHSITVFQGLQEKFVTVAYNALILASASTVFS